MSSDLTGDIRLRCVADEDLPIFFRQQLDPDANHMAAFTRKDPTDEAAFTAHWNRIRADDTVTIRTVLCGGQVAGSVASFVDPELGEPEVTYWIGKEYWGRGIATAALQQFLKVQTARPLYGRAAADNLASLRVLQKCGFAVVRSERGFANARGEEIEEVVLQLKPT